MGIQMGMKMYLLEDFGGPPGKKLKFTFLFVAFVTAVSTGYGLVNYLSQQEEDRKQERQERLQSELAFLRSQISPHFIFNILNSIVYLIRSKSSELAESVTIKLSELMRYMLYESDNTQIPIGREIQYLTNYVELQKIRFEEDVRINLSVSSENESSLIEPMLMIPFVENAFKHGVGMITDPEIDIQLHCSSTTLHFKVKNKTAGVALQEDKDHSSGIGIKNVRRRLELLYPEAHKLTIHETGEWYEVELQLNYHAVLPVA
jgi:LytS/YehU family sensor histidine kinase